MNALDTGETVSSSGVPAGCGDGVVAAPEACDDGNLVDGDGCNNDCQISGSQVWCKAEIGDDGGSTNTASAVATDSQGNAIVVGQKWNAGAAKSEAFVAKYASDGELVFVVTLPGHPQARGVVVRPDDSIVVATETVAFRLTEAGAIEHTSPSSEAIVFDWNGLSLAPSGLIGFAANTIGAEPRAVLGILDEALSIEWSRVVDDEEAKTRAYSVAPDLEGNWLLGGTILLKTIVDVPDVAPREINAGFVRKYDSSGNFLWSRSLISPDEQFGLIVTAVRRDTSDRMLVLGFLSEDGPISAPSAVLATIGHDGALLDQALIANPGYADYANDLQIASNGDPIVAAAVFVDHSAPTFASVRRLDSEAKLRWHFSNSLVNERSSKAGGLGLDPVGDIVVVGIQAIQQSPETRALVCKIRR